MKLGYIKQLYEVNKSYPNVKQTPHLLNMSKETKMKPKLIIQLHKVIENKKRKETKLYQHE